MQKSDIRALVADTWRQEGLVGRAGRWRFKGSDVQGLVAIEANWLGRIGVVMDAAVVRPRSLRDPTTTIP